MGDVLEIQLKFITRILYAETVRFACGFLQL